jgi:glucan phosphorylase
LGRKTLSDGLFCDFYIQFLVEESKNHKNMAVLTGYELSLSKSLKQGSDLWLNNPRVPREASGTPE